MDDIEVRNGGEMRVDSVGLSKVIRGRPIVFGQLSENLGGFREKIAPEAIDRTLRERIDLRALIDHDSSKVLGRIGNGTLRVQKDSQGLAIELEPAPTTDGENILKLVNRGDVTGGSFAFQPLGETEDWWDFTTTPPTRTVRDMRVREVSIVTFPAYPSTQIALRSMSRFMVSTGRVTSVDQRMAEMRKRKY